MSNKSKTPAAAKQWSDAASDPVGDIQKAEVSQAPQGLSAIKKITDGETLDMLLDSLAAVAVSGAYGDVQDAIQRVKDHLAERLQQTQARHDLIQDEQAELYGTQSTSLIRAAMASVLECVSNGGALHTVDRDDNGIIRKCGITLNLEAQRTVWDRFELETTRTADEQAVVFTLHRK